jgi:uncharacterized protein (TIGR00303 family)
MEGGQRQSESLLDFVRCINDPCRNFEELVLSFPRNHNACFLLCTAGTKASDRAGISAAGSDPDARRWTPALDAEALILGKTISAASLPVSPLGIVSPVVISRACLSLLKMEARVVNCGCFHRSRIDEIHFGDRVADCPTSGSALPREHVVRLFEQGLKLGAELAAQRTHLVLAECVPGGTTTAMAVLSALGYQVKGLLSSSLPSCNQEERWQLVAAGLSKCRYTTAEMRADALLAVAALGDPMQAAAAGIALAAAREIPVYLAGGSQMLSVWELLRLLAGGCAPPALMVLSTGWVAHDKGAGVLKLVKMLDAPFAVCSPDFFQSKKPGLQAYEDGHVKEGAGAGASMCLARIAGFDGRTIVAAIDACYEELQRN